MTVKKSRQALVQGVSAAMTASQRASDALDEAAAERLGVLRVDLRCLDVLFGGPRSAGELAEAAGLSPAAITALLDRLEAKGYIRRVRDTVDRRRVLVELSDLARKRAWRIYGPVAEEGAALLGRYTDAQLAAITSYLQLSRELVERHRARLTGSPGQDRDEDGRGS
jgi:DNA-binding MarR family transcriptional regulator